MSPLIHHRLQRLILALFALGLLVTSAARSRADQTAWQSYPPRRPLPTPSTRPLADGSEKYVDATRGDDANPGTLQLPWKTAQHAIDQAHLGDTIILRGGIYYEHLKVKTPATADAPLTLRSHPGELVILDGGFSEFLTHPADCWEPFPNGGDGEYQSTKPYTLEDAGGNFADSMIPLRTYGSFVDLRAKGEFENKNKDGVYVGPGVKWDKDTGRIHIRLAHTTLKGLGDENYRGETDPRKMPMIIAGGHPALTCDGAKHFRFQDIVIRGCATSISIGDSEAIEIDGLTLYAMRYGMIVTNTRGLRVINSAFRGFDAPWHPRESGTDVDCFCPLDLVTAFSGSDFEFAYNEFTDHHDCIQFGDVDSIKFHHNLVDHFNDDALDIDQTKLGIDQIYQNRISRCLTAISIHNSAPDNGGGAGLYVCRNVFDLRQGTYVSAPVAADVDDVTKTDQNFRHSGRLAIDHGSPTWPPIYFYQNTVLQCFAAGRSAYANGLGVAGLSSSSRRVFNNIFVYQTMREGEKAPRLVLPQKLAGLNLQVDANLFWGYDDGAQPSPIAAFQKLKAFEESKKQYPPGWTAGDLYADPAFAAYTMDVNQPTDLTLRSQSPAVHEGVSLPPAWIDPLRAADNARADLGAVPHDVSAWRIGVRGQLQLFP